ncbi:MAG: hypothetical protein Q8P25_04825 [Candidatus Curtissbacteria bacterium]|nr:hypothetical protein [Candidatus Curtissbacteria bacterium]
MERTQTPELSPRDHLKLILEKFYSRLDAYKKSAEGKLGHELEFMAIIDESIMGAKEEMAAVVRLIDEKQIGNRGILETLDAIISSDPSNEDIYAEDSLWSFLLTLKDTLLPQDHPLRNIHAESF